MPHYMTFKSLFHLENSTWGERNRVVYQGARTSEAQEILSLKFVIRMILTVCSLLNSECFRTGLFSRDDRVLYYLYQSVNKSEVT